MQKDEAGNNGDACSNSELYLCVAFHAYFSLFFKK